MNNPQQILIFDGHHALHRIMHVPDLAVLQTKNGQPTGGLFGVLKSMRTVLEAFPAIERIFFVWDGGRSRRRMEIQPTYKADRIKTEPKERELQEQYFSLFRDQQQKLAVLLHFMGIRQLRLPQREADDIIGHMSRMLESPSVIVSEDRDLFQLVSDRVSVWRPIKGVHVTLDNFAEVAKISPKFFVLKKAIEGDDTDNIPGIEGVGETTAIRALNALEQQIRLDTKSALLSNEDLIDLLPAACQLASNDDKRGRKRYAALTENIAKVRENLQMVDVSLEEFTASDLKALNAVITADQYCSFNEQVVLTQLSEFELAEFVSSWSYFSRPFRQLR